MNKKVKMSQTSEQFLCILNLGPSFIIFAPYPHPSFRYATLQSPLMKSLCKILFGRCRRVSKPVPLKLINVLKPEAVKPAEPKLADVTKPDAAPMAVHASKPEELKPDGLKPEGLKSEELKSEELKPENPTAEEPVEAKMSAYGHKLAVENCMYHSYVSTNIVFFQNEL